MQWIADASHVVSTWERAFAQLFSFRSFSVVCILTVFGFVLYIYPQNLRTIRYLRNIHGGEPLVEGEKELLQAIDNREFDKAVCFDCSCHIMSLLLYVITYHHCLS